MSSLGSLKFNVDVYIFTLRGFPYEKHLRYFTICRFGRGADCYSRKNVAKPKKIRSDHKSNLTGTSCGTGTCKGTGKHSSGSIKCAAE